MGACLTLCRGAAIPLDADHATELFARAPLPDIEVFYPEDSAHTLSRRSTYNSLGQIPQLTSLVFDYEGDSFNFSIQSCIDRTLPADPYIDRRGNAQTSFTIGDVYNDIRNAYSSASIGISSNPNKANDALYSILTANAQAAQDKARTLMDTDILCPGQDDSHDELRKLLQTDSQFFEALFYRSVVTGAGIAGLYWYQAADVTGLQATVTALVLAGITYTAGLLDYAAKKGVVDSPRVWIGTLIANWFSKLMDGCKAIWDGLKAAGQSCLTIAQVNANAGAAPGAVVPQLGVDNNNPNNQPLPEGQLPTTQPAGECIA